MTGFVTMLLLLSALFVYFPVLANPEEEAESANSTNDQLLESLADLGGIIYSQLNDLSKQYLGEDGKTELKKTVVKGVRLIRDLLTLAVDSMDTRNPENLEISEKTENKDEL
ncbi:unnamed protein product [Calicophoron daubneyi]|uniref:Uncharacterized protein n=1 Tax=Calicophoron daubneyi TaxID=300641 RepID=A0AAV2T5T2_CALDB